MALSASKLIALGVSSYSIAIEAELSTYAGCVAGALSLTHWRTQPYKAADAKLMLRKMALDAGIPKTDWEDKVSAVMKCASKLATKLSDAPELIAVRDANDELTALQAMRSLFAIKGLTCRHYFKQWSNQDSTDKFDPEAANNARRAKEEQRIALMMEAVSDINASSEAAANIAATNDAYTVSALAHLTPVQRFAMTVAGMSDQSEIDAFHAVLSARQAELRAIADAAAAIMPAAAAAEPARPTRGARSKARREAAAA